MQVVSDLSAARAKRQRYPVAINTSSAEVIISNTVSHQEEPGLLGERADYKP